MAGLGGGLGFFLGGLGTAFQRSYNASAELQLERQRMAMAEKRQQMADMENKRASWWEVVKNHIEAVGDANPNMSDADILKPIQGLVDGIDRTQTMMGYPRGTATTTVADMLARRRAMQAQLSGVQNNATPQVPGPVPFVNVDEQGQGQPSSVGQMPQQTQGVAPPDMIEIKRLTRGLTAAHASGDFGAEHFYKRMLDDKLKGLSGHGEVSHEVVNGHVIVTNKSGRIIDLGQEIDKSGASTQPGLALLPENPTDQQRHDAVEQFLAALPGGRGGKVAEEVQELADYRLSPTNFSTRSYKGQGESRREQMMGWAGQLAGLRGEQFDQKEYASRSRAVSNFAVGKQGDTARSFNVLVDHLDVLQETINALKNGDTSTLNMLKNRWQTEFGLDAAPNTFEGVAAVVSDELGKAIVGGQAAQADREALRKPISRDRAPQLLNDIIDKYKRLAGGQLKGLRKQYEGSTGLKDFDKRFLFPSTIKVIQGGKSDGLSDDDIKNMSTEEINKRIEELKGGR